MKLRERGEGGDERGEGDEVAVVSASIGSSCSSQDLCLGGKFQGISSANIRCFGLLHESPSGEHRFVDERSQRVGRHASGKPRIGLQDG